MIYRKGKDFNIAVFRPSRNSLEHRYAVTTAGNRQGNPRPG